MASAKVLLGAEVYTLVASNSIKKGDVLTVGLVCTPPVQNSTGACCSATAPKPTVRQKVGPCSGNNKLLLLMESGG